MKCIDTKGILVER